MVISKKLLIAGVALGTGLAMAAASAFADVNANAHASGAAQLPLMNLFINSNGAARVSGTVTAVSGSTLSVKSWGGTWTVDAANAAVSGNVSALSEVKTGDAVAVTGTATSGMDVTAKTVVDLSVSGTVSASGGASGLTGIGAWLNGLLHAKAQGRGQANGLLGKLFSRLNLDIQDNADVDEGANANAHAGLLGI